MKYETCHALTLEFLSSLKYKRTHGGQERLLFRIRNQEKNLTDERLGQMFGVVNDGSTGAPVDYHVNSLWEALTGQRTENMQNLKATLIHHPAIRIFVRFLSYTINSRVAADTSNSKDLEILGSLLRPDNMPRMNYVYCLKKAFAYYTRDLNIDSKQDITIGGLVSHIAACLNLGLEPPESYHDCLITKDHL